MRAGRPPCLVYMMQQTSSGLGGVGVSAAPLPLSKKSTKDTTCARHRQHAGLGALASPWQPTQRYPHRGRRQRGGTEAKHAARPAAVRAPSCRRRCRF